MNILTISLDAWNDTLATGNSFSNFFNGISSDDNVANIYCRNIRIENKLCDKYFFLSEKSILSGIFNRKKCGRSFMMYSMTQNVSESESILSTKNPIGNLLRRYRPSLLLFAREFVWLLNSWKNENLRLFLLNFKPDVIYMHCHGTWYMHSLLWYCQHVTGAKVAVFSGDDIYAYKGLNPLGRLYQYFLRKKIKHTFTKADIVFGGSPQLCEEYGKVFNIQIIPLIKSCSFLKEPIVRKIEIPLQVSYCGNLLYGRDVVLSEISKQIAQINHDTIRMQLHIYSNTSLSSENKKFLNDGVNCIFEGAKPFSEIQKILDDTDLTLFAESFSLSSKRTTRLSFSTKIVDYFQSNSALIVVGPSDIASIDYLIKSNVCIVVNNIDDFIEKVNPILQDPNIIGSLIAMKYQYAKENLSTSTLVDNLKCLF